MKILVGLIGIPLLLVGAYMLAYPTYSWRQKMTVEVEFDGKTYSGSSVVQVHWNENDPIGAANGPNWVTGKRGEAVVVDLDHGRYLFALLNSSNSSEYTSDLATRVIFGKTGRARGKVEFKAMQEKQGQTLAVPRALFPLLVTFTDINDPASVKKVDPGDLAVSFGAGYRLKGITLEITDEKVTSGRVEKVLGWLGTIKGRIKPYTGPMTGTTRNLADIPDVELLDKFDFVRK